VAKWKLVQEFEEPVVNIIEFMGRLYVATQARVYVLGDNGRFEPLDVVELDNSINN
jgi:hypothetical protein